MSYLSNNGYVALKKQSDPEVAVTPDVYTALYEAALNTKLNLDHDTPILGHKFARHQVIMGMRGHGGSLRVLAEPNTAGYFFDMLLNRSATSGSDPYTHTYEANATIPNSYTIDVSRVRYVERFVGCQAAQISVDFDSNKMIFDIDISGLKSVGPREITNVASLVLTLSTEYDPKPATGYLVGDIVRLFKADGSVVDTDITAVSDTTITVSSATGVATGDTIALRPATPSLSLLTPFQWATLEFRFGATAAAALSASQTRLDQGSTFSVKHEFNEDEGEKRSGSYDPAALLRKLADVEFSYKAVFTNPTEHEEFLQLEKKACVVRAFSTGGTYELRLTLNHLKFEGYENPLNSSEIQMVDAKLIPQYDSSDGQAFDVKVINAVASI